MQSLDISAASLCHSLRSTVTCAVLDNGAVLLDLESKYFYALNASGWAIAQLFESGMSVDAAQARARVWGAPPDGSIGDFIAQLHGFGLLELGGPPADAPAVGWDGPWITPSIERQSEPLQNIMVSAFDPSIPLAE